MVHKFTTTLLGVLAVATLSYGQTKQSANLDLRKAPKITRLTNESNARLTASGWKDRLGLPETSNLVEKTRQYKSQGESRSVLQQYHQGYPVEGAVYYVHYKNGKAVLANGELWRQLPDASKISLSPEAATQKAQQTVTNKQFFVQPDFQPTLKPQLVYVPVPNSANEYQSHKLAYKVNVSSQNPLVNKWVYVDAATGKIVRESDQIHTNEENGTAVTRFSGTQAISTTQSGGQYVLRSNGEYGELMTLDCNEGESWNAAVDFTDADNHWDETANMDDAAYDAHWGALKTLKYFKDNFGLESFDGNGTPLRVYVHFGQSYVNAFWNGSVLTFGDGNTGDGFEPLTAIDVVAHEFGHGVTQFSANLEYAYESGALNESFSDIFGAVVEAYAKPNTANNYTVGEEITSGGIRSMSNPNLHGDPDTYGGDYYYTGSGDNGGVHINSGVQNFWFYLLSEGGSGTNDLGNSYNVTGLGMDKAVTIAYRNLSTYLTMYSTYHDAAVYSIQAAEDLYGACSEEARQTAQAWYAVGVLASPNLETVAEFQVSDTYSCTTATEFEFTNRSQFGGSYLWNFGDGTTSTAVNPVHRYTQPGTYTVTLTAYPGSEACGSEHTIVYNNLITVEDGEGPLTATCTPQFSGTTCCDMGISGFSLAGTNFNTEGTIGYTDHTCSMAVTLNPGGRYVFSAEVGYYEGEYLTAAIDWNNNGSFESSEFFYSKKDTWLNEHTATLQVPSGIANGSKLRMRLRSGADYWSTECSTISRGEVEDYTISIVENTSAPQAAMVVTGRAVPGVAVQLQDASTNVPTAWQWSAAGATISNATARDPYITFPSTGTYQVSLTASNQYGSSTTTQEVIVTNSFIMCSDTYVAGGSGTLYDSGGEYGNYTNDETCSFTYEGCGVPTTIYVNELYVESGYDYLMLYDGTSSSGQQIYNSESRNGQTTVVAQSGSFYVRFTTDGSVTGEGFEINWEGPSSDAEPVADFTVENNNSAFGEAISFINASQNAVSQEWDFGDGSTSDDRNPRHTYSEAGEYSVTLSITSCNSMEDQFTKIVTVQEPGELSLTTTNMTYKLVKGTAYNDTITLNNVGAGTLNVGVKANSNVLLYRPTDYYYYKEQMDMVYDYISEKLPEVSLDSTNTVDAGELTNKLQSAAVFIIGIHDTEMVSSGVKNAIQDWVEQGGTVVFWGTYYNTNDYGLLTAADYSFDFGTSEVITKSQAQHPYLAGTSRNITLKGLLIHTTFNTTGLTNILTYKGNTTLAEINYGSGKAVFSGFYEPFDDVSWDETPGIVLTNIIEANASSGSQQEWLAYKGMKAQIPVAASASLPIELNNAGLEAGTYTESIVLTTNNPESQEVTINIALIVTNEMVQDYGYTVMDDCGESEIQFSNESTMSNSMKFEWDFGDGTTSTDTHPVHNFAELGTYTVKMKAYNGNNMVGTAQQDVVVDFFTAIPHMPDSALVRYEFEYPANIHGTYKTVNWDFGNGDTSTELNPKYTYPEDGKYTMSFTATNSEGCTISYQKEITVGYFRALGLDNLDPTTWNAYPNPTTSIVNLELPAGKWNLRVVDAQGKVVQKEGWNSFGDAKLVELDKLPKGLYILYLDNGKQQAIKKLVLN